VRGNEHEVERRDVCDLKITLTVVVLVGSYPKLRRDDLPSKRVRRLHRHVRAVRSAPASRADHPDEVLGRNRQERQQ
jgi:hypothetical protein